VEINCIFTKKSHRDFCLQIKIQANLFDPLLQSFFVRLETVFENFISLINMDIHASFNIVKSTRHQEYT
jgi:hypothetical protein